jgi:hypothetical protein
MYNISKRPTNAVGFMNEILSHSNHRHVSAIHVAVFRVVFSPREWPKRVGAFVGIL